MVEDVRMLYPIEREKPLISNTFDSVEKIRFDSHVLRGNIYSYKRPDEVASETNPFTYFKSLLREKFLSIHRVNRVSDFERRDQTALICIKSSDNLPRFPTMGEIFRRTVPPMIQFYVNSHFTANTVACCHSLM